MNPRLFGTDGIRGEAHRWPFTADFLHALGRAIGELLSAAGPTPRVLLGRDTRESGQWIGRALSSGVLETGVEVLDPGVMTTPGVAFLTRQLGLSAGIVISASHNPAHENGIKLFGPDGFKLSHQQEAEIERLTREPRGAARGFGRLTHAPELGELYRKGLTDRFPARLFEGLRILLDCANGAASETAPRCFAELGADPVVLGGQPTGTNINLNCGSEHVRRNSRAFGQLIRSVHAHFGVAFDGDADRSVFVTQDGALIDGDHLLAFFAQKFKQDGRLRGDAVVATLMSNSGLETFLRSIGVTLKRTPVGDRFVIEEMRKIGCALGGEQAGHVIIHDGIRTTGDGIFTALLLASMAVADRDLSLSRVASIIQKVPQVIASARIRSRPDLARIPELDEFNGRQGINLRYSGTEPVFRAMVEGNLLDSIPDVARTALQICKIVQHAASSQGDPIEILDCATGESVDLSAISA